MTKPRIDDPDLPIAELTAHWPRTVPVFLRHHMLCVGCYIAPFHTVVDACALYELDLDAFMQELTVAANSEDW